MHKHYNAFRLRLLILFALMVLLPATLQAGLSNTLRDHPSPYLAMHADDPVAWQTWGKAVLETAKREDKLIFVSIGYFSCHWCHVMQRESYSDKTVAKYLNKDFIPVKVDRELNPALDAYLIEFVRRTRGYAGWPLNVFITPEGYPIAGLTYMPLQQFRALLTQLIGLWRKDKQAMKEMAKQAAAIQDGEQAKTTTPLKPDAGKRYQQRFLQDAIAVADDLLGGFGDRSKFPMTSRLQALLELYQDSPNTELKEFLQLTLNQMSTQGLRDHIGGGFFRYTVDPGWHTPHFEKMLYTNAELTRLFLNAAKVFKRRDYEAIARETMNFMIRELMTKEGAMVASLSAVDNAGVEGGYYLWDLATVKKLLNKKEFEVVRLLWKMDEAAPFDAGYLPHHAASPDTVAEQLGASLDVILGRLAQAQLKLLKARKKRQIPVDTKLLASWNGLALSALSDGARLKDAGKYKSAAQRIRNYLVNTLWDGKRLHRAWGKHGELGVAGLEDYAYAAEGLLDWALLTDSKKDKALAIRWIETAWRRFFTTAGWKLSDKMLLPKAPGMAIVEDTALQSPSTALLRSSLRVARLDDNKALKARVAKALSLGQDLLSSNSFIYGGQIVLINDFQAGQ